MRDFRSWFVEASGLEPHPWQIELAADGECRERLIRIPTGMGKTLGVVAAWSFHRLTERDRTWPRRLVWVLPIRALVEQTMHEVRKWLGGIGLLWDGTGTRAGRVAVHVFMGGTPIEEWHLDPEHESVLIGTQDMLLSRALNRGYGAPRARWPMEFALLQRDALWVFDEVQLMDVGLTTSVQLQAFRSGAPVRDLGSPPFARSWWMSATLQPEWLRTADFAEPAEELSRRVRGITGADAGAPSYTAEKPLQIREIPQAGDRDSRAWAQLVAEVHAAAEPGPWGRISLAIANTVEDARLLHEALSKHCRTQLPDIEIRLVHSRFRPLERKQWRDLFLSRQACTPGVDRIIVSTQVVEAGVDMTATALVTALAPWSSLVQRFGRAARYGGRAPVVVVDRGLVGKSTAPYEEDDLAAAREVLGRLESVSPDALEAFEHRLRQRSDPLLARLYHYAPLHELCERDLHELFDTGPDLTGADLDISRYIRSGDERDLQVWWWPCDDDPPSSLQPRPEALCPLPAHLAKKWLLEGGLLKEGCHAWVWDYLDGRWRRPHDRDLYPGRILLVAAAWGGYDVDLGWTGARPSRGAPPIPTAETSVQADVELQADLAQDTETRSELPYKTIATHGAEVAEEAGMLAEALGLDPALRPLLDLAARVHDVGKSHAAFQAAMVPERRDATFRERVDLAKAPREVWRRGRRIFGDRRGFRHELASGLALFSLLSRHEPFHPALLGELRAYAAAGILAGADSPVEAEAPSCPLAEELAKLDPLAFDLVVYLTCSHHGKVRVAWQPTPADERLDVTDTGAIPLRGILEGDALPGILVASAAHTPAPIPGIELHLDPASIGLSPRYGASWRERVTRLRRELGDSALAYLEAILRTADVRASRRLSPDPLLEGATE